MKEGKRKVAFSRQERGMNIHHKEVPVLAEPDNLRSAMNAHGAGLLGAIGQQMNAHLDSLVIFEGTTSTLTLRCRSMVLEIGKLLEAIEHYQASHAEVLIQAALLRRLVAEFAQHVHNSQSFGTIN